MNASARPALPAAVYGRIVFGASAAIFGIASLLSHDSDLWQYLQAFPAPLGTVVAWCFAFAQVAGGLGMLLPRPPVRAAMLLGAVFGLFVLAQLALVAAAPAQPGQYVDLFEQLAVVCGAFAASALMQPERPPGVAVERALRVTFGVCTVSFAWAQVQYFNYTAGLVPAWIPPSQAFWTIFTTVAFVLAAVAALIDREARLALRLTALMVALFGVIVWVPRVVEQPATLSNWSEIALNFLIAASALLIGGLRSSP